MEDSIIIKGGSQCKVKPVIVVPRNYPGSLHTSISLFHYCVTSAKTHNYYIFIVRMSSNAIKCIQLMQSFKGIYQQAHLHLGRKLIKMYMPLNAK